MRTTSKVALTALLALVSTLFASQSGASPITTTTVHHSHHALKSVANANGLISLNLLSGGKPQALSTPSGDAFFSLYVPARTIPKEFVASLLIRGPVTGGIATITTPSNVFPEDLKTVNGTTTFSAPLTPADNQNGVVTIHVHVDLNLSSKYLNPSGCTTPDSVVAQIQTATGILGGVIETPTTPADFWPPILSKVTVWVPPLAALSPADARAASLASMQVGATIAQQYGPSTAIAFRQGEPPAQTINPTVRNVVLQIEATKQRVTTSVRRAGSTPLRARSFAAKVQPGEVMVRRAGTAPVLVLEGSAATLVNEARSISKAELALATAAVARNFSAHPASKSPSVATVTASGARQLTLAQLGAQTSIEGLGTVDVLQALSQSQFGAPISSLQLRLQANYSVPPVGGVASFSVLVGNYIVASQRLTTAGSLTMLATVPTSVLNRSQSVDFRLNYSPPGGYCHAGLVPVQVTIDPSSGFSATSGQTLPPGFDRSPQDVAPGFNVDLVSPSDDNLIAACELITSLAQILPQPPLVNLVSPSMVTSGHETELVVGATRATTVALKAPIALQTFRTVSSSGLSVGYSVRQPFAVLESFEQNGRDVILSGAYQQSNLANSMLSQIATTTFGGWFALGTGQIAIMTSDQRIRFVGAGAVLAQLTASNPANNLGIPTWLIALIAFIVLVVVLRFLWFTFKMSRLRRRASKRESAASASAHDSRTASDVNDATTNS